MNNILSTKTTSSIILTTLLVLGTIATISPTAQAQPYYEENRYEPEYPSEYTINNSYEPEYPSDNSYDKSKDSSTVIKKINCNNINSNNNGVDVNLGIPNGNDALVEAQAEDEAATANGLYGEKNNNNFKFVCSNDNNNINIVEEPIPPVAEDAHLVVSKIVTCEPSPPDNNRAIAACEEIEGEIGGFQFLIEPNEFTIAVSGDNPNPSQFEGSGFPDFPVVVTLGVGDYQVSETADPSVATTIADLEQIWSVDITQSVIFSGDCDAITGEGTLAEGEVHLCQIENAFTATALPPGGLTASNTNTDTSAFNINTAGGLASSLSSQLPIAQGTGDSSALEKIEKLKKQWLELLP